MRMWICPGRLGGKQGQGEGEVCCVCVSEGMPKKHSKIDWGGVSGERERKKEKGGKHFAWCMDWRHLKARRLALDAPLPVHASGFGRCRSFGRKQFGQPCEMAPILLRRCEHGMVLTTSISFSHGPWSMLFLFYIRYSRFKRSYSYLLDFVSTRKRLEDRMGNGDQSGASR